MMIAKYSAGFPLEEFSADYINILETSLPYWEDDQELSKRVNLLSIGVILEVGDACFDSLVNFFCSEKEKYFMFDYMINYRKPDWEISDNVRFEKVFGWIKHISTMDKTNAEAYMLGHLDSNWYTTHKDYYWHDSHKSKVNTYFGYWCFEAGAIAKIMGLDDTALKENQYFPYDMLCFAK
jgi:hypothetical protein